MKKLKFRLQLVAEDEEESAEEVVELAVLEKDCKRLEHLGLSLAGSKEILGTLQQHVLERQVETFVLYNAIAQGAAGGSDSRVAT